MSSVLKDLGQLHVVAAKVVGISTASITSNDGSATLTDNGTGDYTVTFGDAFLSVPAVSATVIDATISTAAAQGIVITAVATGSVQFQTWQTTLATAGTDIVNAATDLDFHFIAVGMRNN